MQSLQLKLQALREAAAEAAEREAAAVESAQSSAQVAERIQADARVESERAIAMVGEAKQAEMERAMEAEVKAAAQIGRWRRRNRRHWQRQRKQR